jgi:imidazole glycerol-phosphate synthase subunit HisF
MPKQRIIACLVMRDEWIVQSIGFSRYLPVGRPEIAARFLDDWGVDEIVLLDISAGREGRCIRPETVSRVSQCARVPLTAGGGIRTVDDVHRLIAAGADKIVVNTLLVDDPGAVRNIALHFGDQCVVASIDAQRTADGSWRVVVEGGRRALSISPDELARRAIAEMDAGEILINSIDGDGSQQGYDLALVSKVAKAAHAPVIALGGAGLPHHLHDVLRIPGVCAAAVANILHFSEHSIAVLKAYLAQRGVDVRIDAAADYRYAAVPATGRLEKRSEAELRDLYFRHIPREVISVHDLL